jgi:hypothetical protein
MSPSLTLIAVVFSLFSLLFLSFLLVLRRYWVKVPSVDSFKDHVIQHIGRDLIGYVLDDVAIDLIEERSAASPLLGQHTRITQGPVTADSGVATLSLQVRSKQSGLEQNDTAKIIGFDEKQNIYWVEPT